jgi:hypothetical protein
MGLFSLIRLGSAARLSLGPKLRLGRHFLEAPLRSCVGFLHATHQPEA